MDANRRLAEIAAERNRQRLEKLQKRWQELEQLIRQAQSFSIRYLKADELLQLGKLYRLAVAELARSNSLTPNRPLHRLVGWGYSVLYAQPPLQRLKFWHAFARLLWRDFPAAVINHLPFLLLAASALFVSSSLTVLVVLKRPEVASAWLGEYLTMTLQEVAQRHKPGADWLPLMGRPFAFWLILLNNLRVALMGYGFGMIAMLPSLYVLFVNGKIVAAQSPSVTNSGLWANFWASSSLTASLNCQRFCSQQQQAWQLATVGFAPATCLVLQRWLKRVASRCLWF
jgi:Integral membrane protein DUF95.